MFLNIMSTVIAGTGSFNYVDFDSWGGECAKGMIDGEVQQSPIDIPLSPEVTGNVKLAFKNFVTGQLALEQHLKESDEGQLSMILESPLQTDEPEFVSFDYNDKKFSLDHIHSHWGSSEHLHRGVGAAGNFHMVFKAEDGEISVIEVKFDFTTEDTEDVLKGFPRCPAVSDELLEKAHSDLGCPFHDHSETVATGTSDESDESFEGNILGAFGLELTDESMINYKGSLTTPPCSTGLNWFVIQEPVLVYDPEGDMLGCNSFQQAFPHKSEPDSEECQLGGNFRPPQVLQKSTEFNNVKLTFPEDDDKTSGADSSLSWFIGGLVLLLSY